MNNLTIELPVEFTALCARDAGDRAAGFIADLTGIMNFVSSPRADGYSSNGSDERDMARAYYEREATHT